MDKDMTLSLEERITMCSETCFGQLSMDQELETALVTVFPSQGQEALRLVDLQKDGFFLVERASETDKTEHYLKVLSDWRAQRSIWGLAPNCYRDPTINFQPSKAARQ